MASNEIQFINGQPHSYTNYTIMPFSNWRAMESFAKYIQKNFPSTEIDNANDQFRGWVDGELRKTSKLENSDYGMFGLAPKSYDEAMSRKTYLPEYYKKYKEVKKSIERMVMEELQKISVVQAMKPKLVFNDKEIGEFVFDRAAMSLQPEIYHYSPSKKREINLDTEKVITKGDKMFLESDKSLVILAIKVEKPDGTIEFIESKGEETLKEAADKKYLVSVTSSNKKVYLYKEKKPKMYKGVKIIVGLTRGGWTGWLNDYYTGMTAVALADILETLDYSVAIEVVMGGGRCDAVCGGYPLNFSGVKSKGRRFFSFNAKTFDEQMDTDGLLYTLADPSFHNVKFVSLLNTFFGYFGDALNPFSDPLRYWHGIEKQDMVNPIGMYHKYMDMKKGNKDLMHFYVHRVADEIGAVQQVKDIVLTVENKNKEALIKYANYDFGDTA
jgi:hypothetical protein